MKVRDILAKIDAVAPFRTAEEWDNVGLMVGDPGWDVRRLAIAVDPCPEAVEEAFRKGCQGLLTHHPLFFKPLRNLDFSSPIGRTVHMATRAEMAVIAAHTNWDRAETGVNRTLAKRLKLGAIVPLVQSEEGIGGMGATGDLSAVSPVQNVLERMKAAWNLTRIDYYGNPACSILRVALCGGSGGGLWPMALAMKADLFVTADMKYHEILDCVHSRLPVAIADHGEMEGVTLVELARHLAVAGELEVMLLDHKALETPLRL
ncbi:MAG: Nif3-like dinuclear metal center hexameric protein [Synergistaceae bacterium]|jgi:dinuclear metal center YbgI/SA1388 family protein|nr:Nif3-like dinuclear metal center hexameric protein [Synergistaceae bacterium]